MAMFAGFDRLRVWLRRRQPCGDLDPANVGTAYGMELCLKPLDPRQPPAFGAAPATAQPTRPHFDAA